MPAPVTSSEEHALRPFAVFLVQLVESHLLFRPQDIADETPCFVHGPANPRQYLLAQGFPLETGATITRTFFYQEEDPHLYVDTEIKGRGRTIRFRRVYNRTD